jgi:hypothetical protein
MQRLLDSFLARVRRLASVWLNHLPLRSVLEEGIALPVLKEVEERDQVAAAHRGASLLQ